MHETRLDGIDLRLLAQLQQDGHMTAEARGRSLGLSASQAGRRRARLEERRVISGYAARVDAGAAGLHVQAFIQVEMAVHDPEAARDFARRVEASREIVSAWTLTGEADYLLRAYCEDLAALNRLIHERLLPHRAVARVRSQIVMAQLKADAPLPV